MTGFISGLAAPISRLLELKHAIGLPYQTSERHLRAFDAMCARDYPEQDVLTRQMAMAWAVGRPGEHVNGQMRRITPVRQLAKHMAGDGATAYVIPPGIPGKQVRYRPHIFTHDQLRAIFDAADRIQELYLSGDKAGAIAAVPDDLVRNVSLIGPQGYVRERIAAIAEAGVTTLLASPVTADAAEYVDYIEQLQQLLP